MYIPLGVGAVIPPWNFPCAIMAGMTRGLDRQRQHRHPEAVERFAHHRREVRRTARRSRHARGRRELLPRRRSQLWRCRRGASEDPLHRFHRIARSRTAHQQGRGNAGSRPDLDQARHSRDGRQRRDHRRCRRRHRFRRRRRGAVRVRLPGPEVLSLLARHRR